MTEREKQIEEMAKLMCGIKMDCRNCNNNYDVYFSEARKCASMEDAERLYNAGYRKHTAPNTEVEWVDEYPGSDNILCKNCESLWNRLDNCVEDFVFCPCCGGKIVYLEEQSDAQ